MNDEFNKQPWYNSGWKIIGAGLASLIAIIIIVFVFLIIKYWWQIKRGEGAVLQTQFKQSFTAVYKPGANFLNPTISRAEVESTSSPFMGRADAPVVIVEFMDYKCPNSRLAAPIMSAVVAKYGNKVKVIIRDFPAETLHPGATRLAYLAYCARQQGRFPLPLYNILFSEQDNLSANLTEAEVSRLSVVAGLSAGDLIKCMAEPQTSYAVQRDFIEGVRMGVSGTPTFFVNGQKVEGVVPLGTWEKLLNNF